MNLSFYTTGRFRGVLPPGILHATYSLHQDVRGMLHHDPVCSALEGPAVKTTVPVEHITVETECPCLVLLVSAPTEFQALTRLFRWHSAVESINEAQDDTHFVSLHHAWRRLHGLIKSTRSGMSSGPSLPASSLNITGAGPVLLEYLQEEYHRFLEIEEATRNQLRNHPERVRLQETHQVKEQLPEGTYLVASADFGLGDLYYQRALAMVLLQMDGIDPFAHVLLGEANEEVLSLALYLDDGENTIEYVLLEESDTPDIREIARTLWDPPTVNLSVALQIARTV